MLVWDISLWRKRAIGKAGIRGLKFWIKEIQMPICALRHPDLIRKVFPLAFACLALAAIACNVSSNKYEVIGRSEKEVPNYQAEGSHTAVDYVLLHDGHKIYAECDVSSIGNLDPTATCGFRPLRTYECTLQTDSIEKATLPLSDLKCKDADGHNVYLYVNKKE